MKISTILVSRNDNYSGEDYLKRMYFTISHNIHSFSSADVDFEYIIVDWCPLSDDKMLHNSELLKPLYEQPEVRGVVVDNSVLIKENLNPMNFYEYFGKNAGVRNSTGEYLLITNADIILPKELCEEIKSKISDGSLLHSFGRARYRGSANYNGIDCTLENNIADLHHPEYGDACICGLFSGDFLLCSKQNFETCGKGYDELSDGHRTHLHQTSMDGEILWNMHKNNMSLCYINSPYFHITHPVSFSHDSSYNQNGYNNKPNWGFIDYKKYTENNIVYIKNNP